MRRPIIAGNWKMYKKDYEAVDFVKNLKPLVSEVNDRTIVICPSFVNLAKVCSETSDSNIALGAQDLYWEDEGAFTGEVSAPMLSAVGCTYTIIGHSERRQFFGETNQTVNKKILSALKYKLFAIVCVGESLEEREKGITFQIIEKQIKEGFTGLAKNDWEYIVIAYEPVWAIGTGKTATTQQAQEVHAFIRGLLPAEVAQQVRILYGGSIKPENIKELMAQPDIDGGLVGGASLKVESFAKIIKY